MNRDSAGGDRGSRRRAWWPITVLVALLLVTAAVLVVVLDLRRPAALAEGWAPAQVERADDAAMTDVVAVSEGFVAAGHRRQDGRYEPVLWRSQDGRTWAPVAAPALHERLAGGTDAVIAAVYTSGQLTVAAGWEGPPDGTGPIALWVSPDEGSTWERLPHEHEVFADGRIDDLTSGSGGVWIAVGTAADPSGQPHGTVWRSPDGRVWERLSPPSAADGPGSSFEVVTSGGEGLVAVGSDQGDAGGSEAPLWTSMDGTSWRQVRVPVDVLADGATIRDAIPWRLEGMMLVAEEAPPEASRVAVLSRFDSALDDGTAWSRSDVSAGGVHATGLLETSDGHVLLVGWTTRDGRPHLSTWLSEDGATWEAAGESGLEQDAAGSQPAAVTTDGSVTVIVGTSGSSAAAWVHGTPS